MTWYLYKEIMEALDQVIDKPDSLSARDGLRDVVAEIQKEGYHSFSLMRLRDIRYYLKHHFTDRKLAKKLARDLGIEEEWARRVAKYGERVTKDLEV
jgi:hypothetical protein